MEQHAPQRVPVNMYEATDAVVVLAPLPGVMNEDIDVTLDGNTLEIKAGMRTPGEKEFLLHEWHYGPYERRVDLPGGYGGDAEATFGNGQLAVRITRGTGGSGRPIPVSKAGERG